MKLVSVQTPPDSDFDSEDRQPCAWEESYPAPEGERVIFRSYHYPGTAQAIAGILEAQNVPAFVVPPYCALGMSLTKYHVVVEARMAHRARWLLEEDAFTDAELCYLATEQFPGREG